MFVKAPVASTPRVPPIMQQVFGIFNYSQIGLMRKPIPLQLRRCRSSKDASLLWPSVSKVSGSPHWPSRVVIAFEAANAATCLDQTSRTTLCTGSFTLLIPSRPRTFLKIIGKAQIWLVTHERCFVRWGIALNSATKQITDIVVLQQAETSLQKASGGFSFFGGRQDKCAINLSS